MHPADGMSVVRKDVANPLSRERGIQALLSIPCKNEEGGERTKPRIPIRFVDRNQKPSYNA